MGDDVKCRSESTDITAMPRPIEPNDRDAMDMDGLPRVSVVLPVRNGGSYIATAVESILNQSFRNFEVVIIDDGSTDETPSILQHFTAADDRIRVMQGHGRGITQALNLGVAAAKAPLIARMDSDDVALPARLACQVEYLDAHEDCVAVGTSVTFIDPDGDPLGWHRMFESHTEIVDYFLQNLGFGIAHPAVMFRRDAFLKARGYDEQDLHAEDYGMFLRLSEIGRFSNIPEPLLQLRLHNRQVSAQHNVVQRRNAIKIAQDYCARHNRPLPKYGGVPPCAVQLDAIAAHCSFAARAMLNGRIKTSLKHLGRAAGMNPGSPLVWITALRISRDLLLAKWDTYAYAPAVHAATGQDTPLALQMTKNGREKYERG